MRLQTIITRINENIEALPGDLFCLKSNYLKHVPDLANHDIESAIVKLGKAGERLAKGCLEYYKIPFNQNDSFDSLIKILTSVSHYSPTLIVGLRTVLKYRNQAAHDSECALSAYDLDAAVSSFCAAYQAVYSIIDSTGERGELVHKDGSIETISSEKSVQKEVPDSASPQLLNETMIKKIAVLSFFSSAILLWAVAVGGPYSFFIFLRIVVTINAVLLGYLFYKGTNSLWIVFLGIAILFNPILPVHLTRSIWKVIDLVVMFIFIVSGIQIMRERK